MIRRFLDLSTAHIKPETNKWLQDQQAGELTRELGSFWPTDSGWFIWTGRDIDVDKCPPDLLCVMVFAKAKRCDYVMVDRDASTIDDVPIYDW